MTSDKLLVIKLGGSLITDKSKPLTPKLRTISKLAKEVKQIHDKYPGLAIIIGNGAGSFGHFKVKELGLSKKGKLNKNEISVKAVHDSVERLNHLVVAALCSAGLEATPVSGQEQLDHPNRIKELLAKGVIPSVYGDILARKDIYEVISTEEMFLKLLGELQTQFAVINVIFVTSVDGVLDTHNRTIEEIGEKTTDQMIWGRVRGFDITGGMKQKLEHAFQAAKIAKNVYIIGAKEPGNILAAIENKKVGTKVHISP